jgi:ATP-dependent helicase/DNAse subunit B
MDENTLVPLNATISLNNHDALSSSSSPSRHTKNDDDNNISATTTSFGPILALHSYDAPSTLAAVNAFSPFSMNATLLVSPLPHHYANNIVSSSAQDEEEQESSVMILDGYDDVQLQSSPVQNDLLPREPAVVVTEKTTSMITLDDNETARTSSPALPSNEEEDTLFTAHDFNITIPKVLSPSALKEYENCPQSFFFQYILKLKQPTNTALAKGSMCHSALEQFLGLEYPIAI